MKIIPIILLAALLTGAVSAWTITTDTVSQTSITWNVSEKTDIITELSYDGISVSDYNVNAQTLVQSNLKPGEFHFITVNANGTTSTASATTNASAQEDYYSQSADTWAFLNQWFYVGLIIVLFILGFSLHWSMFFIGSFISLFALAKYLLDQPVVTIDIWALPFLIYGALFVIGFILWAVRKRNRRGR